jgi:hypothetical protein
MVRTKMAAQGRKSAKGDYLSKDDLQAEEVNHFMQEDSGG